jgi:tRNA nucleotidyltransferase (CCA-adding enzyme)
MDGTITVADQKNLEDTQGYLQGVLEKEHAFGLKNLAVGGKDLMEIGVPQGPEIGRVLNTLLERVIEDPALNTHSTLIDLAKEQIVQNS